MPDELVSWLRERGIDEDTAKAFALAWLQRSRKPLVVAWPFPSMMGMVG